MNNILSYFSPQQTIILIVVSIIGAILIILNIVLAYIFHKRGERKLFSKLLQQQREIYLKQLNDLRSNQEFSNNPSPYRPFFNMGTAPAVTESQEQVLEENEEEEFVDENQDVIDEVVINGKVIRYNKSFMARLIQASDISKERYSILKNHILSYKGVKNKISWKKESFRLGRTTFASFVIRGKSLCLCLALDPKQFTDTKYKVNDLSIRSPKTKLPCLYRIINDRRVKYAIELIDMLLIEDYQADHGEWKNENYIIPYETSENLIERGLIRVIGEEVEFNLNHNTNQELNSVEEEEVVVDTALTESLEDDSEEDKIEALDEDDEIVEETVVNGIVVRYNRSFVARLSQSTETLNSRYSELKNYILAYKGVKNRISWKK